MSTTRPVSSLRSGLALAVLLAVVVVAVARTSRNVPPLPALARSEVVARRVAASEPVQRAQAKTQFPFDLWSQDDAFQVKEQASVRAEAKRSGASVGSVLQALDDYQRANPSPARKNGVSPCKPRPFYD